MKHTVILWVTVVSWVAESQPHRTPLTTGQLIGSRHKRQTPDSTASIVEYTNTPNSGDGTYAWRFATDNGIVGEERGSPDVNTLEGPGPVVVGSYSYVSPDGKRHSVTYSAGGDIGFAPVGEDVPAIPPAILKALEYNAQQEAQGVFDDGSYRKSLPGTSTQPPTSTIDIGFYSRDSPVPKTSFLG